MSGFFGIFRPGGESIDLDQFDQMKKAMHRDGYDGMETYVDDHIAVGHMMLRVGNASEYDQQPLKSDCGNYVLVGHFRLDYRDELGDKLGLTQFQLEKVPDSKLALLAYLKWHDKCVHHLEGDWVFFIYNKANIEIQLYKSWIGNSSLYYFFENGILWFSSSVQDILKALSGKLCLDEFRVKELLLSNGNPIDGKTVYLGLDYLKNGYTLLHSEGRRILSSSAIKKTKPVCYKFEYDYKLDFLSSFSNAVKTRICVAKNIGIFLSGGLDSSAVGYCLAKELLYLKKDLISFTSIPYFKKELSEISKKDVIYDESDFVAEFSKHHSNLKPEFLNFKDEDPLNLLFQLSKENAYCPIINKNAFWILGILQKAKEKNIDLMFSAQAGNYTISQSGSSYYVELLLNSKIIKLVQLLFAQSKTFGFLDVIKVQLLVPAIIYTKTFLIWNKIAGESYRKYLIDNSNDKKGYSRFVLTMNSRMSSFFPKMKKGLDRESNFFEFVGNQWAFYKGYSQICISDPTTDLRLVNYLNSIPGELFFKNLKRKYLFQYTFNGMLPNKTLTNKKRMLQSYDFPFRIIRISKDQFLKYFNNQNFKNIEFNDSEIYNMYQKIVSEPSKYVETYELIEFLKVLSFRNICNFH